MPHRKLRQIIAEQNLVCVEPSDLVSDVFERMQGNHVGSALVLKNNEVHGIFTGSNMLNRVIKTGLKPDQTTVNEVMTPAPVCLDCSAEGLECLRVMRNRNIRHIVVRKANDGGYGIISVRDFPNEEICELDDALEFENNLWEHLW